VSRRDQLLDEPEGEGRITTFADLMTLLLVFFVLLFSMSTVETERFEQMLTSLQMAFGDGGTRNAIIELPNNAQKLAPATDAERRHDFRVTPSPPTPINLRVGATALSIVDIATNGIAFTAATALDERFSDPTVPLPALLYLGQEHHPLPITLQLIIRKAQTHHCRLIHHSLQGQKILSRFSVAHQKYEIRATPALTTPPNQRPEIF